MTTTGEAAPARSFAEAYVRLKRAQKDSRGAPLYSRFVNRPVGRLFAAAGYRIGLSPNAVTGISAVFTFAGIGVLAAGPATWPSGLLVAVLLMIGYALDAADGQLARLQGGGSPSGEWLDHLIDSAKLATIHLAVLVAAYRTFELPSPALLLVPLAFSAVQSVHFFGMIITDLVLRERHALTAPGVAFTPPSRVGSRHSMLVTVLRIPVDYGLLCLTMATLGAHLVFFGIYTVLAAASAGYLLLALVRWYRLVRQTPTSPQRV